MQLRRPPLPLPLLSRRRSKRMSIRMHSGAAFPRSSNSSLSRSNSSRRRRPRNSSNSSSSRCSSRRSSSRCRRCHRSSKRRPAGRRIRSASSSTSWPTRAMQLTRRSDRCGRRFGDCRTRPQAPRQPPHRLSRHNHRSHSRHACIATAVYNSHSKTATDSLTLLALLTWLSLRPLHPPMRQPAAMQLLHRRLAECNSRLSRRSR